MRPPPWYVREDLVPPALERAEKLNIFGYRPASTSTEDLRVAIPGHNVQDWFDTCDVPTTLTCLMQDLSNTVPSLLRDIAAPCPRLDPHERLSTTVHLMVHLLCSRSRHEECRVLLAEELNQRAKELTSLAEKLTEYLDIAAEGGLTEEHMNITHPEPEVARKPEELKRGYYADSPVTKCLVCLQYFIERLSVAMRKMVGDEETNVDAMVSELSRTAQDFLWKCKNLPSFPGGANGEPAAALNRVLEDARLAVIEAERKFRIVDAKAEQVYNQATEELYRPFQKKPPTVSVFSRTEDSVKDRPQDPWRLSCEAEFVQALANPTFLRAMLKFLEDERFRRFLEYLKYWHDRRYALLLTYPVCLQTLELLTDPQSASTLCRDAQAVIDVDHSIFRQWARTRDRNIRSMPASNLGCNESLPPDLLGPDLLPPQMEPTIGRIHGPRRHQESLTEAATYAGRTFFDNAGTVDTFGNFAHVYMSYPLPGFSESLWKFEDTPSGDISPRAEQESLMQKIEAPIDPVLLDNRLPTPPRDRGPKIIDRKMKVEKVPEMADARQNTPIVSARKKAKVARKPVDDEASSSFQASASSRGRKVERRNTSNFSMSRIREAPPTTPKAKAPKKKKKNVLDGAWSSSIRRDIRVEVRNATVYFNGLRVPDGEVKYDIGEKRYHWGKWIGAESTSCGIRSVEWQDKTEQTPKIVWTELQE